jgi:hypothetical protein
MTPMDANEDRSSSSDYLTEGIMREIIEALMCLMDHDLRQALEKVDEAGRLLRVTLGSE